jgi:hypothetical protein
LLNKIVQEDDRSAEELCDFNRNSCEITGARQALEMWFTTQLSDGIICHLFGGIKGSSIKIEKSEKSIDVWTSNEWYSVPLYYSIERGHKGVIVTINDIFLKDNAPKTLGTRIIATMVLQATKIPGFDSITASATRWFYPIEGNELSREVIGYYFFPRLGFNADPKNADDYIDIPEKIKGKKLLQIMRNPELRQWWKGNGQTIDVKFKITDKKSLKALVAYLTEKRIRISIGEQ